MGTEATFVEVCSKKGAELLEQAKIADAIEIILPVPKGLKIREKIEQSMLNLSENWRKKDFLALGEEKTRLLLLRSTRFAIPLLWIPASITGSVRNSVPWASQMHFSCIPLLWSCKNSTGTGQGKISSFRRFRL